MRAKYLSLVAILILSSCASHPAQLYKKNPAFYSYIIGDAKTDYIDEEYAAEIYATPASCQKTITALVALKFLGADYRYQTKIFTTKHLVPSKQDVVIAFSGDPNFTSEDLLSLLEPLKGTKNRHIILDATAFATPPYSNNLIIDDIGSAYAQPVSAINIDKNLINLEISASPLGEPAIIQSDIDYKIDSNLTTNSAASAIKLSWNLDKIKATGSVNFNDQFLELKISPREIDPYIIKKLKSALELLRIDGKIKIAHDQNQLPTELVLINNFESQPLKEFIIPALKKSDNLVFDSLYLKIIHTQNPQLTDWNQGDQIIKDLIRQYFEIDFEKALFVDGSGLSRYNRLQPKKLLALLKKGLVIPEFMEALPTAREEKTTLEKRHNLSNGLKAKTGNMSGLTCLCGYNPNAKKPKAFVIMSNSFSPPAAKQFEVIDDFISSQVGE